MIRVLCHFICDSRKSICVFPNLIYLVDTLKARIVIRACVSSSDTLIDLSIIHLFDTSFVASITSRGFLFKAWSLSGSKFTSIRILINLFFTSICNVHVVLINFTNPIPALCCVENSLTFIQVLFYFRISMILISPNFIIFNMFLELILWWTIYVRLYDVLSLIIIIDSAKAMFTGNSSFWLMTVSNWVIIFTNGSKVLMVTKHSLCLVVILTLVSMSIVSNSTMIGWCISYFQTLALQYVWY